MLLQYFIFDKTGNKILEASAIPCSTEQELQELATTMVDNYHSCEEMQDLGLLLMNNANGTVLYNSREEK